MQLSRDSFAALAVAIAWGPGAAQAQGDMLPYDQPTGGAYQDDIYIEGGEGDDVYWQGEGDPYGQPSYPNEPYGQPPYPQQNGYPQQPYGQPSPYAGQQPYGQPPAFQAPPPGPPFATRP